MESWFFQYFFFPSALNECPFLLRSENDTLRNTFQKSTNGGKIWSIIETKLGKGDRVFPFLLLSNVYVSSCWVWLYIFLSLQTGMQTTSCWNCRHFGQHQCMFFHSAKPTVVIVPKSCTFLPCQSILLLFPEPNSVRRKPLFLPPPFPPEFSLNSYISPASSNIQQCSCHPSSFFPNFKRFEAETWLGILHKWLPEFLPPPSICSISSLQSHPPQPSYTCHNTRMWWVWCLHRWFWSLGEFPDGCISSSSIFADI